MEDKLDTILLKLSKLQKSVDALKEVMDAHKVEHGFAKMQDGGVNAQFTGQQSPPGMGGGGMPMGGGGGMPQGMPGMGQGMGQGYQMPGQGMPIDDPTRPPM